MIKRLVCTVLLVVGTWAGGAGLAEASCAGSHISVLTRAVWIGETVPVGWGIGPVCDVIETGLLLGIDPASLAPVGEPIYGYRPAYQQTISVAESGPYWIAAYAMDEAGGIIQSPPRLVGIMVPPRFPGGNVSQGDPPFTGTDADFLQPAGNPHFASLRRFDVLTQGSETNRIAQNILNVDVFHSVGSTHPGEVLAGQAPAVTVGGLSLAPNPADVSREIDGLTQNFTLFNHPRPGFYVVGCTLHEGINFDSGISAETFTCSADPAAFDRSGRVTEVHQTPGGLFFGFEEASSLAGGPLGIIFSSTFSERATATYFIPGAPPESRLLSATLRLALLVLGDPSPVRLNGKPAERLDGVSCQPFFLLVNICRAIGTWNFTQEAAALVGQGGGELTITADPIPQAFVQDQPPPSFLQNRDGFWRSSLAVNYPWSHGFEVGSLTLSFQQGCQNELTLAAVPDSVPPRFPSGIPRALAGLSTEAAVEVVVKSCPPGGGAPASVDVALEVLPPQPGSAQAGGHRHDERPSTAFGTLNGENQQPVVCTANIDPTGTGSCTVTYRPSEVSGVEAIIASAAGFPSAQAQITVAVPDLMNLALAPPPISFRLTGMTPTHQDNHWGTAATLKNAQLMASDVFKASNVKLGVNDMSLPFGGMFDICGTWNPKDGCTITGLDGTTVRITKGHDSHRRGTSVDIDRNIPRNTFQFYCAAHQGVEAKENPYHCEFPN